MTEQKFEKILTANDTGHSKSHQAGIHVPKGKHDLLAFLPPLDARALNPSAWLNARDESGVIWRLRYIYYNNRLHSAGGTRDEFRITHLTAYMRAVGAAPGDRMTITGKPGSTEIRISVISGGEAAQPVARVIQLRGWRRVH
jgi:hypothetical protein